MRPIVTTRTSATSDQPPLPPSAPSRARLVRQGRRDTQPELALRRALHARGWRYRVDVAPLPRLRRRADLVFPRLEVAIFVDGCFWHRCPVHATVPKNNAHWWADKLAANVARDRDTDHHLEAAGWLVLRIWEHTDPAEALRMAEDVLSRRAASLRHERTTAARTGRDSMQPAPDDKDWTWVLERPCAECGFDVRSVDTADLGPRTLAAVAVLREALARPDATTRPRPAVWSALEYACHVRDVCVLFHARLQLMLDETDPVFANWDQDATAIDARYEAQQPAAVSIDLDAASREMAGAIDQLTDDQRNRPGRRSNGSAFTVESLSRYFLHDLVHHAHDVMPRPSDPHS